MQEPSVVFIRATVGILSLTSFELFSTCPSSSNVLHLPNTSLVLCLFKYTLYFWEKMYSSLYVIDQLAAHLSDFLEVSLIRILTPKSFDCVQKCFHHETTSTVLRILNLWYFLFNKTLVASGDGNVNLGSPEEYPIRLRSLLTLNWQLTFLK